MVFSCEMPKVHDLRGQVFGRLTVLQQPPVPITGHTYWWCKCSCGTKRRVSAGLLKQGKSRSCGCLRREVSGDRARTHGLRQTPEYHIWLRMKQACSNPKHPDFAHYGGRGIVVCDRWIRSFVAFYQDMGPRPSPKGTLRHHSKLWLDRIDNYGPYAPENCRWASMAEQSNNRRNNRIIEFNGLRLTRAQWEHRLGYPPELIKQRLKLGWTIERILTTPRITTFHPQLRT